MVTVANTKMMVRPTRRISRAISLGVFCRSAPSTSLIMRSRNVDPTAAVMRTLIQSDSTWVPPVTAERSPPDSRMTGADSPVIAASFTEAEAGTGNQFVAAPAGPGQQLRLGLGALAPQRRRLRLAAALGDRLGEIGEQHREPQPQHDLKFEADMLAAGDQIADQDHGGERRDDLEHEHHRILHQAA